VELFLDAGKYKGQLAESEAATESSTGKMSAAAAKSSAAMTNAWTAAAVAAVLVEKASVGAAIELNQATDKLTNSIENSTKVSLDSKDAFLEQADAIAKQTGVSNDAIISAESMAVQFGLTADQVKTLIPLVVDLSVKNGVDLTTAMSAVGKAVNGNSGALSRLKLAVDKTQFATDHYGATLKALGAVEGYAAQQADAEPWKKFGETVHELGQTIGEDVLPTLQAFGSDLDAVANKRLPSAEGALGAFGFALKVTGQTGAANFLQGMQQASHGADDLKAAAHELQGDLESGNVTLGDAQERVKGWGDQFGLSQEAIDNVVASLDDYIPAAERSAGVTHHLAEEQRAVAAAARDQKQAEDELAGGALGVISSLQALQADQEKYNKLKQQGHLDSQRGHELVQQELEDQVSLTQAFDDYIQNAKDAGDTSLTFRQVLSGVAHDAGISRQALIDMLDGVNEHGQRGVTTLDQLQDRVNKLGSTKVTVPIDLQIAGLSGQADFATQVRAIIVRELAREGV
jgi:hypothetical protein